MSIQEGLGIACIASLSVGLGSKEKPRNGTGAYFAREIGARAKIRKRGRGRGRKETLADKPMDFENLHSPVNRSRAREWLDQSNIIDMCPS